MTTRQTQIPALVILLLGMLGVFHAYLPYSFVDRLQENVYLGVPYHFVAAGRMQIIYGDPFTEMGPQSVYPPAVVAYRTHSLKPVRYYQFGFSLVMMALLFLFFFTQMGGTSLPPWGSIVIALVMFVVWYTIPLSLVYPAQVNGMTGGFCCLLLGLFLLEERPYAAMMAFGFAYSFKGQFLGMVPGLGVYLLFFDDRYPSFWKQCLHTALGLVFFFIPTCVIVPLVCAALGMFTERGILGPYAWTGPGLLHLELRQILRRLNGTQVAGDLAAVQQAIKCRREEYSGFGFVTWSHVVLSAGFCLLMSASAFWYRLRGNWKNRPRLVSRPLVALALMGGLYWLNYLVFYAYPYWYNVFAIIVFNSCIAAFLCDWVYRQISARLGTRPAYAFLVAAGLICFSYSVHCYRKSPAARGGPRGDSLDPYPWMSADHS